MLEPFSRDGGALMSVAPLNTPADPVRSPRSRVLIVDDDEMLARSYARYLERRIRDAQPYAGLPIILTLRPRTETRRK